MGSQHRRSGHRRFLCPTGEDVEADDGQRGREQEVQIGKLEGPHTPGREQSLETGQTIPTPPVLRGLLRGPDGYYIHRSMREDDVGGEAKGKGRSRQAAGTETQESSWVPSLSALEDSGIEGTPTSLASSGASPLFCGLFSPSCNKPHGSNLYRGGCRQD